MRQQGFILPALLLTVTLIFIAVIPQHNALIRALRSKSELSLTTQADNNSSSDALASAFQFTAQTHFRQSNKCFLKENKANRISVKRNFCASYYANIPNLLNIPILDNSICPESENRPRLDFENLFRESKTCAFLGWQIVSTTAYSPSKQSVFSSNHCQLKGPGLLNNLSVAANLAIPSLVKLSAEKLSARGFLISDFNIELSKQSHTISAGGDLTIAKLTTVTPSEITLISATGNVILKGFQGPLSIRVFAAGKSTLPPEIKTSSQGFGNLSLDFLPLGFERTD